MGLLRRGHLSTDMREDVVHSAAALASQDRSGRSAIA